MKEYGIQTDSYKQPREFGDAETTYILLKRLIILTPRNLYKSSEYGCRYIQ